ncbi:MAG: AsmA-like C-terminal region-containing protein [Kiritimatiellales bacterium]
MKNKLKKSTGPDVRAVRPKKFWRHLFRLTGFALGLSVLLALFALLTVGLPPGLTRRITAQAQAEGIPLQVESIRLSTHRGWVFNNARLYSTSPDDLQPLLSAKKLYVMFWPVNWKNLAGGGWHIKIFVRDLGVSLGRPWETVLPENHPFRTISKLNASLAAEPGRIIIENADLRWGGITITARGAAAFPVAGQFRQDTTDFRRSAAKAADALSQLSCDKPPQLSLTFNFDDAHPEETSLDAVLTAGGLTLSNRVYKQLSGALGYRNQTWTLSALQLVRVNSEQLTLRGAFNVGNSNAQVSVENTLSAADLFSLLPEDAQSAVAQTGIKPYGRFDFSASVGPAPYDLLTEKVEVQVQQAHLKRQDITLDPLAFHLVRDGKRIEVNDIQAHVNGGPLTGSFKFDMDSKAWTAKAKVQCDPAPVCALADDAELTDFVSRFRFPAEQLKADLTVSQSVPGEFPVIAGTLSGRNFICGGVPIEQLETFMVYSNRALNLFPLHIARGKEQFDGSVQVNFASGLAFFNATNSFPPVDIAHILAPEEHTILEQFRFNGSVYAAGTGQIDYGSWTNHNFKGTFRAENISMGKVHASGFKAALEGRGKQLVFTNAAIQFYSGLAEGSAEFTVFFSDSTAPYSFNARISQLDLAQMLGQLATNDYSRTRGTLSGTLNLTADANAGFWQSVRGGGQVKIESGRLADVPLFGGFSRLTQSVFPGFNLFSLTAFSADCELHDGAVWSDNAQLGGTLVSARGRGSYSPEKGLNFTVAAEPLRQTNGGDKEPRPLQRLAASALREGTAPLFRLLEFKLEGPLEKPEWRFVNLPKEIPDLLGRSKEK